MQHKDQEETPRLATFGSLCIEMQIAVLEKPAQQLGSWKEKGKRFCNGRKTGKCSGTVDGSVFVRPFPPGRLESGSERLPCPMHEKKLKKLQSVSDDPVNDALVLLAREGVRGIFNL